MLAATTLLLVPTPAIAGGCPGAHARAQFKAPKRTAAAIRCLVDAVRVNNGVGTLRSTRALTVAARRQLRAMLRSGRFGHRPGFGRRLRAAGYRGRAAGENLGTAEGSLATPYNIVVSWWNSPAHRANMLDARWRSVGVSVSRFTTSRRRGATVVAVFGAR